MSARKECVQLLSGKKMPLLGIGTYRISDQNVIHTVIDESLRCGFRSIDTAEVYRNEKFIGDSLKILLPKYNLTREDVFITTKLDPRHGGNPESIKQSVQNSLTNLGVSYIDLYLIHWPGTSRQLSDSSDNPKFRDVTWKTLVELHKSNVLRSIGVSNYTIKHLTQLLSNSYGVKPAVNQVELHPSLQQKDLIAFCNKEGIHVQAYSSLGTSSSTELLTNPVVQSVATELNVSPARVLLKWALQQGIGVIPKASKPEHIEDNSKLDFEISESQMKRLSELPPQRFAWNPEVVA